MQRMEAREVRLQEVEEVLSVTYARQQGVGLTSHTCANDQACASRQHGTATLLPMYDGLDLTLADDILGAKPSHASPHDGTAHGMKKCVGCSNGLRVRTGQDS